MDLHGLLQGYLYLTFTKDQNAVCEELIEVKKEETVTGEILFRRSSRGTVKLHLQRN
jgi:hypothetical protein